MSDPASNPVDSSFTVCVVHDGDALGERERSLLASIERIRSRSTDLAAGAISFDVVAGAGSPFSVLARDAGFVTHDVSLPNLLRLGESRSAVRQLAGALGEARVVHPVGSNAAVYACRAASQGRPKSARGVGVSPSIVWQLDDQRVWWPVVRWIRKRTHCWIAPTSHAFARKNIAPSHPFARIVPHALRDEKFKVEERSPWDRERPPVVGMLGHIDLKENHHIFLEMARIVAARRPTTRFTIAAGMGPGEQANLAYADSLGHLVKAYGLTDQVSFRARPNDLNEFFDSIDVFVEPSSRPGADFLGLLAMARGLPVIGTLTQGFPDFIVSGDTGWLTLPRDARGMSKACQFLLGNAEMAVALGRRAKERTHAVHTLDMASARLESVYRELAGGVGQFADAAAGSAATESSQ